MIPFYIEYANGTDDSRNNNIFIHHDCSSLDNYNLSIIDFIIEFMDDFCLGYDITINSFDDFCKKYWDINGNKLRYYENIFFVYYFDLKWENWSIEENKENIYIAYNKKY